MNRKFDYVILGSGLVECALASILSSKKKKVIILDRNDVYGSELATLRYSQLEAYFGSKNMDDELLKLDKEFCIDLTPKLLLADSDIVRLMVQYRIDECVDFINIPGSFIYKDKLYSVPTNETQSLKTGLVSFWEKYSVMKFFWDVRKYANYKLEGKEYTFKCTMREEFDFYGLSESVREFIGHAIALNLDDSYLERHPSETFDKICLYVRSILSYGDSLKSPYIYPKYGISEIVQGFARNACISGAEVMLRAQILDINVDNRTIKVKEPVENNELTIQADMIISDQSYIQMHHSKKEVIRAICIIKGDSEVTKKAESSQIIFLKSEFKRKNDIFVVILGKGEEATPEGYKVAIISTVKETDNPENEVLPVIKKLGNVVKYFTDIKSIYETKNLEKIIFTRGVDESTHFESLYQEIEEICSFLDMKKELKCEEK